MYDSLGAPGVRTRLARRDDLLDQECGPQAQITSDKLTITLDPYHDHLTRDVFEVNPSGVIGDQYAVGQNCLDPSWDPIWQVATRIDSLGWTAEIRIPFSQLRFSRDTNQTWGLQIVRVIDRLNERDQWAFYKRNEASGASRFGHLTGLVIDHRPGQLELLPYTLAQEEATGLNRGNPIDPVNRQQIRAGGDLKYLLSSSLTLDATVNPDFGQVDLDPAVINLSPFETFYPEKRPFFVSGANAFDYGGFNCMFCSNVESMSLFYSRRIGRTPQLSGNIINSSSTAYYSVPSNTQILGAAKITGRTQDGLSIGVLDALTNQESAHFVGTPTQPERDLAHDRRAVEQLLRRSRQARVPPGRDRRGRNGHLDRAQPGYGHAPRQPAHARRGRGYRLPAYVEQSELLADGKRRRHGRRGQPDGDRAHDAVERALLPTARSQVCRRWALRRSVRYDDDVAQRLGELSPTRQGQRRLAVGSRDEPSESRVRGERPGIPAASGLRVLRREPRPPVDASALVVSEHLYDHRHAAAVQRRWRPHDGPISRVHRHGPAELLARPGLRDPPADDAQ